MRRPEADIRALINKQSKRDKQVSIGPSEIGNPCDRCLGLRMAHRVPDGPRPRTVDRAGLKAWVGTGVHYYLKHLGDKDKKFRKVTQREFEIPVCEIKGYGKIVGHCDLIHDDNWSATVVDYKTSDKAKIAHYKTFGVPEQYRAQGHLYGYGVEQNKRSVGSVQYVGLFFIPRDSNNFDDIWYWEEPYDREVAEAAIRHAERIFKRVKRGELELLESHPSCYDCSGFSRDVTFIPADE